MSINDALTVNTKTWHRTDFGKWIESTSTIDEPRYLTLTNTDLHSDKNSSFVVKVNGSMNHQDPSQADQTYQAHLVVNFPPGYQKADMIDLMTDVYQFASDSATLTKILQGRR